MPTPPNSLLHSISLPSIVFLTTPDATFLWIYPKIICIKRHTNIHFTYELSRIYSQHVQQGRYYLDPNTSFNACTSKLSTTLHTFVSSSFPFNTLSGCHIPMNIPQNHLYEEETTLIYSSFFLFLYVEGACSAKLFRHVNSIYLEGSERH